MFLHPSVSHSVHRGCLGPAQRGGWGGLAGGSRPRLRGDVEGSGWGGGCPGPHQGGV